MDFVQWNDALSTGVAEIDEQHQALVAMLNALHDASTSDDGSADIPAVVGELKEYAMKHFATEERFMKRKKYPEALDHMAEHAFFISKVRDFTARDAAQRDMLPEILDFLKKWLVDHISNVDVKMGRFLREAS